MLVFESWFFSSSLFELYIKTGQICGLEFKAAQVDVLSLTPHDHQDGS